MVFGAGGALIYMFLWIGVLSSVLFVLSDQLLFVKMKHSFSAKKKRLLHILNLINLWLLFIPLVELSALMKEFVLKYFSFIPYARLFPFLLSFFLLDTFVRLLLLKAFFDFKVDKKHKHFFLISFGLKSLLLLLSVFIVQKFH